MKLDLFDFIANTIQEYELNLPTYSYVEGCLKQLYTKMMEDQEESVVTIRTRVKTTDSLKEKLIRNKFYLHFDSAQDAILHLNDLIGITIQCQFIRDEAELYQTLFRHFQSCQSGFSKCLENEYVYLNLHMSQPQVQRNGFTIYRIDGYYLFNGKRINYELQIKALVHNFWSEIEHEVVYKNPDFVAYDRFLKEMLATVRDNLDVVDHQLEVIYDEISAESKRQQIGMDEKGFKILVASSINELVNRKMKESVGFTTDFKKCSAILAQYIYIHDFVNGENNQIKMVDYLEHLNYLSVSEMDFKEPIELGEKYTNSDAFCQILGNYWQSVLNTDFEWHVFFVMLFAIQPGENLEDFSDFIAVIKKLLIQPSWYESCFSAYQPAEAAAAREFFETVLAQTMTEINTVEIVHENMLLQMMNLFRKSVTAAQENFPQYKQLKRREDDLQNDLNHQIKMMFH